MTTDAVKLAPSILAADFAHLGDQVAEAERAGADRIHVDVMDGHFVLNLFDGTADHLDEFALAGTDLFIVHWERPRHRHKDHLALLLRLRNYSGNSASSRRV